MTNTCYVLFYPPNNLLGVLPASALPHLALSHREETCLQCCVGPVPGRGRDCRKLASTTFAKGRSPYSRLGGAPETGIIRRANSGGCVRFFQSSGGRSGLIVDASQTRGASAPPPPDRTPPRAVPRVAHGPAHGGHGTAVGGAGLRTDAGIPQRRARAAGRARRARHGAHG